MIFFGKEKIIHKYLKFNSLALKIINLASYKLQRLSEKILKLVPPKTHDWHMYVKPEEILEVAEKFSFRLDKIKGMAAIPSLQGFKWIRINNTKTNYIISIIN